MIGFVMKHK